MKLEIQPTPPSIESLRGYVLGQLSAPEADAVARYLEGHPQELATIDDLVADDTLLAALRDGQRLPPMDTPEVSRLVQSARPTLPPYAMLRAIDPDASDSNLHDLALEHSGADSPSLQWKLIPGVYSREDVPIESRAEIRGIDHPWAELFLEFMLHGPEIFFRKIPASDTALVGDNDQLKAGLSQLRKESRDVFQKFDLTRLRTIAGVHHQGSVPIKKDRFVSS